MPYSLERKLVVAIASSALFDLAESDAIFQRDGEDAYRQYQREHENDVLQPGVAFQFIKRLLALNEGDDSRNRSIRACSFRCAQCAIRPARRGHLIAAGMLPGGAPFPSSSSGLPGERERPGSH